MDTKVSKVSTASIFRKYYVYDSSRFPDTPVTTYEDIRLYDSITRLSFCAYRCDSTIADLVALNWRFHVPL
jgi:hypothetical protein